MKTECPKCGLEYRVKKKRERVSVPGWIREEIKETWKTTRQCGSQMEAFRIFERMTDRLGYGRTENNPSLAAPTAQFEPQKKEMTHEEE